MSRLNKNCAHCGKPKNRACPDRSHYCLKCDWPVRCPLGPKAGAEVAKAIRNGELKKPTDFDCVDCGKPATEYDHRDYTKPLQVDPVCRSCNIRRGPAHPYLDEYLPLLIESEAWLIHRKDKIERRLARIRRKIMKIGGYRPRAVK